MIYVFPLLIVTLVTLMFYYRDKEKLNAKIDDLITDLQKEMEEKLNIESKYNKMLNDLKKEEELKRNKNTDEMQLLFTKVNMLDDKLTYFNTNFKSKLEQIVDFIENTDLSINKKDVAEEDLEQNAEEEQLEQNADQEETIKNENDQLEVSEPTDYNNVIQNIEKESEDNEEIKQEDVFNTKNDIPEHGGDTMSSTINYDNEDTNIGNTENGISEDTENIMSQDAQEDKKTEIENITNDESQTNDEPYIENKDDSENNNEDSEEDEETEKDEETNKHSEQEYTSLETDSENSLSDENTDNALIKEESPEILDKEDIETEDHLEKMTKIKEQENSFDNSPVLDINFLDNPCMNTDDVCPINNPANTNNLKDNELTSALDELNKMDMSMKDEDEEKNIPPKTILSENKKNGDEDEVALDDDSFDIKDSIEKLKAQLNDNKDDKKTE